MKYLFLSGPHAAGKSYTVDQVKKNENVIKFDTGPIMRFYHKKLAPQMPIGKWVDELEKKYGPKITCFMLAKQLKDITKNSKASKVIIIGFRELVGIKYMLEILKTKDFGILYVDGTKELLYKNYMERFLSGEGERKDPSKTYEEFLEYLEEEQKQGLREIKEIALSGKKNCEYYVKSKNDDALYDIIIQMLNKEENLNEKETECD